MWIWLVSYSLKMNERITQIAAWAHQRRLEWVAAGALTIAAVACGGAESKGNNGSIGATFEPVFGDTPTATIALPMATATRVPEPTVTPMPEKPALSFGNYDVFMGDIEGGGKILVAALPGIDPKTGTSLVIVDKRTPTCSNPTYLVYRFTASGRYDGANMNASFTSKSVSAQLIDARTATGQVSARTETISTPTGDITCPGGTFPFNASRVGSGRPALFSAYRAVSGTNATDAELQRSIEQATRMQLP